MSLQRQKSYRLYLLFSRAKALAIILSRDIPHPVIFLCTPMPPSDVGWCPLRHACRSSTLQSFVTDSSSADPHNSLPYGRAAIRSERRRPLRLLTLMCVLRSLLCLLMCRSFTVGIGLIGHRGVERVCGWWRRALTLSSVQIPQVLGSWRRHGTGYQRGRWRRWRSFGPLHVCSKVLFSLVHEIAGDHISLTAMPGGTSFLLSGSSMPISPSSSHPPPLDQLEVLLPTAKPIPSPAPIVPRRLVGPFI